MAKIERKEIGRNLLPVDDSKTMKLAPITGYAYFPAYLGTLWNTLKTEAGSHT
jgi:hypothetical protein